MSAKKENADPAAQAASLPRALRTRWKTLVLVCRECDTCRDGTKPKDVRKIFRRAGKKAAGDGGRPRTAFCGCLDLCPKAGVATVVCGPGGIATRVVRGEGEADSVAASLGRSGGVGDIGTAKEDDAAAAAADAC